MKRSQIKTVFIFLYISTAVPEAPAIIKVAKADASSISIEWSQPASDGGSPITGFVIEKNTTSVSSWIKAHERTIKGTEYTISNLTEGYEYEFRVAAVNKAGQGLFSKPSQPTLCKPPYSKYENLTHQNQFIRHISHLH